MNQVITFSAELTADSASRTVSGKIVPLNVEAGSTNMGKVIFASGSIAIEDPKAIKLLSQHDNKKPLGRMVSFSESENSIEIKDGLKNQYLILKILMILNLANAIIRIFGKQTTEYGFIEYIWIGLGIISLIVLFMFLFKMSTAEKISIGEITGLEEKIVFGKKRFSLKMKNGKKRNLGNFKDQFELAKARELFTKTGIAN